MKLIKSEKRSHFTKGKQYQRTSCTPRNPKLRGYFREKGYYKISVDIKREQDTLMNNAEIFFINIDKNERVKIKEIIISGNESIPDWKLKMAMKDVKEKG